MMQHQVAPSKGARRNRKRVGRGDAAGQGSTAGRGMKGQKSRLWPRSPRGVRGRSVAHHQGASHAPRLH